MESIPVNTDEEAQAASAFRALSPQQLQMKINYKEPLQLVDIRSQLRADLNNWNYLQIPEVELSDKYKEIHQDITVILISEDGASAEKWCTHLNQKKGFNNIYYLKGGLQAWQKEMQTEEINYESF